MEDKVNIIIPAIELNDELLKYLKEIKKKQSSITLKLVFTTNCLILRIIIK